MNCTAMRTLQLFTIAIVLAAFGVAPARSDTIVFFKTPSGNIGCIADDAQLRCDIRSGLHHPHLPPRGSCSTEVDFGQGLWIAPTGPTHIVCAGDTALDPQARAVPYGTTFVHGAFRCRSESIGLTCRNRSGHGFFLNADEWRMF